MYKLIKVFSFILLIFFLQFTVFAANPIQIENSKQGTANWQLTNPATGGEIEGYASLTSVNRGSQISFFVKSNDANYTIEIFRMGWYGGTGARQMMSSISRVSVAQPAPIIDNSTGFIECNWIDPYVLQIPNNTSDPTDWASGFYLAKLTGSSGKQSYIIFVVRDDTRSSDYLFQSSVTTYQAYNNWGGKSLYEWNSNDNKAASKVSFNRPYAFNYPISNAPIYGPSNGASGAGAGEFLTTAHPLSVNKYSAGWEYNLVRFLEREGYDVTYCTNIDTHQNSNLLLSHKAFLSVGHDEYWSWEMRSNVIAARDQGVSLGFFSSNVCYWQIRLKESLVTNGANRTIIAFKDRATNPKEKYGYVVDDYYSDSDPGNDHLITTKWRNAPVNRPEDAFIGVMYEFDPIYTDMVVENSHNWVFEGTGARNADILTGLVGFEADRMYNNAPAGTELIMRSPYYNQTDAVNTHSDMTVYKATSGATVLATGSMQWNWGLDDYNAPSIHPSYSNPVARQIMRNILARFKKAHSASFNGTDSYLRVPSNASLNITGPFTVEAWIKTNSSSTQQGILERSHWISTNDGGFALRLSSTGKVQLSTVRNNQEFDYVEGSTTVSPHVWHHVAGVFDGTQLRVYLDGKLDGSKSSLLIPAAGTTDLHIGARAGDATYKFNGLIDEARLTSAALYNGNFTPSTHFKSSTGTVGLWKFDNQNTNDSSPNANNALNSIEFLPEVPETGTKRLQPLRAHWKFDENSGSLTKDVRDNHPGTLHGPVWTSGYGTGNALSFDGINDYVEIDSSSGLKMKNEVTISASIYPTGPGSDSQIGGAIVNKEAEYEIVRFPNGTIQWAFANTNPGWTFVDTGYVAPLNQWTHITVTYGNGSVKTYANNQLVHTYPVSGTIGRAFITDAGFRIGGRAALSQYFQGKIDEVKIYNTVQPPSSETSIWNDSDSPNEVYSGSTTPFELGVKFQSSANGFITGIRFYKGIGNTGTHTGHLWSNGGTMLAQATFTNETASGWQTVRFANPVPINANTTYIASYYNPNGYWSRSLDYFANSGYQNGALKALKNGDDGANSVFKTGSSGFPTETWRTTNYWVDILFVTP